MAVTSFTDKKRARYLGCLRQGMRRGASARAADTTPWTVNAYIKEHPEFRDEVEQAEMDANQIIEDALFQKARAGHPTCMIFWLTNRSPDRWADKRNNVQVINTTSTDDLNPNALRKRLEEELKPSTVQQGPKT